MSVDSFWLKCDGCGRVDYNDIVKFVEIRTTRPSNRSDLACIMAGCSNCFPGNKTPEEWIDYIESEEAVKNGHMFLT